MVTDVAAAVPGVAPTPSPASLLQEGGLSLRQLECILFDTCTDCHLHQARGDMSSIPHGVLAARAVAANNAMKADPGMSELAVADPPLKYNSKLMNSIWGLYNRYSVHNFKKNTDGEFMTTNLGSHQQMLATAAAPLGGALLRVMTEGKLH